MDSPLVHVHPLDSMLRHLLLTFGSRKTTKGVAVWTLRMCRPLRLASLSADAFFCQQLHAQCPSHVDVQGVCMSTQGLRSCRPHVLENLHRPCQSCSRRYERCYGYTCSEGQIHNRARNSSFCSVYLHLVRVFPKCKIYACIQYCGVADRIFQVIQ